MARPPKSTVERRSFMIRSRVTESEFKQFRQAAEIAGLTVSDYVRVKAIAALPRYRKPTPERAALIKGLAELGKIGSNLNQIARSLNRRTDSFDTSLIPAAEQIIHALAGVDTLTRHLIGVLDHGD